MKKYVLVFIFLVFMSFILSGSTIQMAESPNLYKNMVDASVRLLGHGSGVFIEEGVILTAVHCLENVKTITIKLRDGTLLRSSDFYIDDIEDIGFIFVTVDELCIAKVTLAKVNLGDIVYLVGRPFNDLFEFSLTKGIVSHLNRDVPEWNWEDLLQVDANGGPGSSGGPLYDSEGRVIGIYVGHAYDGGLGVTLCESGKSILEAYDRCMATRNAK